MGVGAQVYDVEIVGSADFVCAVIAISAVHHGYAIDKHGVNVVVCVDLK